MTLPRWLGRVLCWAEVHRVTLERIGRGVVCLRCVRCGRFV